MRISDWSSDVCSSDLFDAPVFGLPVQDFPQIVVEFVALGQHLVQIMLAQYRAQRGLRQLAGGFYVAFDLDHCAVGIHDPKVQYCVHFYRYVVARDDVLGGNRSEEHTSELQSLMRNSY